MADTVYVLLRQDRIKRTLAIHGVFQSKDEANRALFEESADDRNDEQLSVDKHIYWCVAETKYYPKENS